MEVVNNTYLPGDPRLIDHIVYELKSQGIFDNFRKECIADVDTKPAYQNLRQRVEGSVSGFLKTQKWRSDMNKNQVREMLRKNISESGFLETGVERIVDQVVNPKINAIFLPQVENVVYKVLGIPKPTAFDDLKKEEKKTDIKLDLLPNDLEAISPESESQEKKLDTSNESQKIDEKMDEDESPPFEPIEQTVTHEENSVDSNLSGISGLVSHDSNHSVENVNLPPVEISNPDSQLSKQSSDDRLSVILCEEQETKMEINDDSNTSKVSSTKLIDTNSKPVDVPDSQSSFEVMEITSSTENVEEVKKVEEKHAADKKPDKHHSSNRHSSQKLKHDNKDRKSDKGRKSDKDKKDHRSSKNNDSNERKDKDKKGKSDEKHNDIKSNKEKERERTSSSHRHSKDKSSKRESHDHKNKESSGHKDNKTRTSSESKSKDSKDRSKDEKSRSHSSSKKSKDDKDDRSHSKHNGKSKSDGSDSNKVSTKDSRTSDKSDKKDKHSHNSDKKGDKRDKDKRDSRKDIRKDDHYSLKEKRSHRRSTDRDSSDGQSGTHSSSSSFTDLTAPSQLQKSNQESSLVDSGASTGADSGNSDAILSLLSQNADITSIPCIVSEEENARVLSNKIPHLKLIKPKFASNIFEARRLMKIRKKLGKLEKQKQIELLRTNTSLAETSANDLNNHKVFDKSADDKTPLITEKNSQKSTIDTTCCKAIKEKENQKTAQNQKETEKVVEPIEPPKEEETSLQTSVISKESWDAIEAKLNAQNILKVDYNSYIDSSENSKDQKNDEKQVESNKLENNIKKKKRTKEHNFKGFTNQLVEEAELCLNASCKIIAEWESDLAKLSKAYLIDLAEKDKSRIKKGNEEFNDFNRLPKIEIVDVTSNNEIVFSPGRGIKRIANDHTDVHNNNKISKELGDLLSEKLNDVAGEQAGTPKHKSKKSKLMDSSVSTLDNFNLPLSPAESDKSYNSIGDKRNEVSEGRPRRSRATNRQRYSSDDLYKPRLQFTSTRRRTTNTEKN